MWRLDTAWFFKNLAFHWHSKKKLVPLDNDDYWNPTDPCDKCPEGYECDNGECIPVGPWPWPEPIPIPWPKIDPEPIDPENPTEQTQCKIYSSRGNGIKYTENNTWTWYDANSWAHWTFKCAEKLTFYWRLNHSASSGLVNDIRWWVWNKVRSFTVPVNDSLEQSIFKFTVNVDWTYLIEIKKKASWDDYYDWEVWEAWKLSEADWVNLYMWVSALAEIRWETIQFPDEIVVLYEWDWGRIIHNKTRREVTLTRSNWEELTIMDRNVWATKYYNESWATANEWYWDLFQWWNNYWFTSIPSTSKTTVDTTWYSWRNPYSNNVVITSNKHPTTSAFYNPDWSYPSNSELWWSNTDTDISKQWPCPEWYHIPNVYEALNLLNTWSSITWVDRTSYWYNHSRLVLFEDTLLLPLNWGIVVDQNNPYISRWGIWLLWTTTDTRYDNIPYGAAYRVAFDDYYIQTYTEGSSYMWQAFAKIWWFGIRPFKNKTDVPKYTITFVNYDGTVLQSSKVYSGLLPQYRWETPTKPSDQQYSYTFIWWSPAITIVSWDQTYTAQYTPIMEWDYDFSNNSMTKDEIKALFNVTASGSDFNLTTDWIVPKNRSSSDFILLTTKNVSTGGWVTIQSIELWYEVESGSGWNNLTEILSNQNYMSHTNYASSYDWTWFFRPNISVSWATFTETTARYGGHHPSGWQIYIRIDSEWIYWEYKDTYYNHTLTYSYTAEVAQQFLELLKNNWGLKYLKIMPRGRASIKNFKYKVVA